MMPPDLIIQVSELMPKAEAEFTATALNRLVRQELRNMFVAHELHPDRGAGWCVIVRPAAARAW